MRPILFVTILSLFFIIHVSLSNIFYYSIVYLYFFLFHEAVNGQAVTFSSIVKSFYGRAKNVKSNFDFLLKITPNVDAINKALEKLPRKNFMGEKDINLIVQSVPEDAQLNGKSARTILREKIEEINANEAKKFKELEDSIRTRIAMKSQNIIDSNIITSYQHWLKNSVDANHLKQIEIDYPEMKSQFEQWQKDFTAYMTTTDELRKEIKKKLDSSNAKALVIRTTFGNNADKQINEILNYILGKQSTLAENLKNAEKVLAKYNDERIKWAQFLIGMRATLNSDPKPVELISKTEK